MVRPAGRTWTWFTSACLTVCLLVAGSATGTSAASAPPGSPVSGLPVAAPGVVQAAEDDPAGEPGKRIGVLDERSGASRRLLIAGDSITQGSSGDYTWRYRLWKKLQSTAPGEVGFVGTTTKLYDNVNGTQGSPYYAIPFTGSAHAATWGAMLSDEVDRVADQVTGTGANTLVVMLGINDIVWRGATAAEIKSLYRTYIRRARAAAPGIDIVLCEVLSRYDFFSKEYLQVSEAQAVATQLDDLASEMNTRGQRVVVADTLAGWDAKLHTWDSTHPNPTGETLIAQRVSGALSQIGIGTATPTIFATTKWKVRTSAPSVTTGPEEVTLDWDRVPTGSTAVYLEYNLTNEDGGFHRLPYGIAEQDEWSLAPLVAGGTYRFRTVPIKGFMTGVPGARTEHIIPAKSFQKAVPSVASTKRTGGITGAWTKADNAQGYLLGYRTMAYTSPVTNLPYPVGADITRWDLTPLAGGRYYRFRVVPVRGYVRGTWKSSVNVRTDGVARGRAYIALGDSYSSGLGARKKAEDYDLDVPCRRTTGAWAFKMQDSYNTATKLVACQGDEIDEGIDGGVRAQLAKIRPYFSNHPKAPQLVTVTVGGNDVGFGPKLEECVRHDCTADESDWFDDITLMTYPLHDFYDDLRDTAPNADIIVGGYPVVIDVNGHEIGTCQAITEDERRMFVRLVDHLNTVIDNAAENTIRSGRHKTRVWSAGSYVRARLAGHGACQYGDEEWINAHTNDGGGGLVGLNSFHPNAKGQTAYAFGFADALMQEAE